MMDSQTGEIIERRLDHEAGEAQKFYAALPGPARIGMEATGRTQWFERLLAEQGHELWVGDAAQIRAGVVRKQKTDRRNASHILQLLRENRFPRIWVPSPAERDLRQLLQHRVRLVRFPNLGHESVAGAGNGTRTPPKKEVMDLQLAGTSWKVSSWVGGRTAASRNYCRCWIG